MRMNQRTLSAAVFAAVLMLTVTACKKKVPPPAPPPPPVVQAPAPPPPAPAARITNFSAEPRSIQRCGRRSGGSVCRPRARDRLRMDVRAGAEIRRGEIRAGRLAVTADRPLGGVPNGTASECQGPRLRQFHRAANFEWRASFLPPSEVGLDSRSNVAVGRRLLHAQRSVKKRASAAAFNNADHVSIVIHNCRCRLSPAAGDPRSPLGAISIVPPRTEHPMRLLIGLAVERCGHQAMAAH